MCFHLCAQMLQPAAQPRFRGITHIFIDCDDCLYQNGWATARRITQSIGAYTATLGVSKDRAYQLYKEHGTCLKGLLVERILDEAGAEEFLTEVHKIDYSEIEPDARLREVLSAVLGVAPCWVFTASASEHAARCMAKLGVGGLPWQGIIDTRACSLESKHARSSFEAAMRIAGATDPAACLFCDDSVKNIQAASAFGWRTVLVGRTDRDTGAEVRCAEAEAHLASIHGLAELLGVAPAEGADGEARE
uniref:Pyrimidine 5-nucleotidase n=1 Tax=Emiliania huxleyi TaxID=2903 RepID=A0A7S3SAP1_EMIHU